MIEISDWIQIYYIVTVCDVVDLVILKITGLGTHHHQLYVLLLVTPLPKKKGFALLKGPL